MTLAVVAYPRMEAQSLRLIESFRASHDPLADFIKAHITLVFPVDADSEELAQEARSIAASTPAFAINLLGARASVYAFRITTPRCVRWAWSTCATGMSSKDGRIV